MTTATDLLNAADLRRQANDKDSEARESFERCDTDGFLSQWASGINAQKLRAQADLLDNGGVMRYQALFNLDGSIASTHCKHGQWGWFWVLNDDAAARYGKRFFSESKANKAATRNRNNASKGFTLGTIEVAGYVTITGSGTGLSGAASARVATLPVVEDLIAGNYKIIATDDDTTDI